MVEARVFRIGYNLGWRIVFFVFAAAMLAAAGAMLVEALFGAPQGLMLPASFSLAAIAVSLYLLPLISIGQQDLRISPHGLELVGSHSCVVLPWDSVTAVRFKRVMLMMPYLIVSLAHKERLAEFLDANPRSFLAKWTAHVAVFRWYPFLLRWAFAVPKKMTTLSMLEWLDRRYGGSIVIDVAAVNGKGRQIAQAMRARIEAHQ